LSFLRPLPNLWLSIYLIEAEYVVDKE